MLLIVKVYGLFTKVAQSIDDMTSLNNEDCDPMGLDMEVFILVVTRNTMLFDEEDGSVCDAEVVAYLGSLLTI